MDLMRLVVTFIRLGILHELQYRANFWVQLLRSVLGMVTAVGGLAVVFQHTDTLAGWRPAELLALVGIYFIMGGFINTVIQPSMEAFLEDIRRGTLDFVLTKPADAQLLISLRRLSLWSTFDLVLGVAVLAYALVQVGYLLSPLQVLAFVLALGAGAVIVYSFWLILATFAFWFIRIENILVIFQSLYQAGRWPVGIYPDVLRFVLTFLVPVAFAVTVPAEALIGRLTAQVLLTAAGLAMGIFALARWFWRLGLRHYAGASA